MVETTALVERVAQVMGVDKEKVVLKSVSECAPSFENITRSPLR